MPSPFIGDSPPRHPRSSRCRRQAADRGGHAECDGASQFGLAESRGEQAADCRLQFDAVPGRPGKTRQQRWSSFNRIRTAWTRAANAVGPGHRLAWDHCGMAEKKCSRCAKVKPLAEFSHAAHQRDGRAAYCKDCHNTLYRLPLDRVPTLACLYCGKEFPNPARRGPDRKFCSPPRKVTWWREEYGRRRQAAPARPCERCGGPSAQDRTASRRPTTTGCSRCNTAGARSAEPPNRAPGELGELTTITNRPDMRSPVRLLHLGIGYMRDDPEILIAAARYVMKCRQKKG